ncbi:hypothetical protein [Bradyrhizobium sp.]|uniref:hypothetical protein n=1 Tax=Bradyrhizobium sp. TaxID=376 RepID=UPI001D39AA70|nr:hypothetical protein [Bradyrhizobium sp.]MBI5320121.1 hypothetical protein [Bradyrhizobium sp.]
MRFPGAVGVVMRGEIVAYPPSGSNEANGMPLILISGDCELRRKTRATERISARPAIASEICIPIVMAGLVPAIHDLSRGKKNVDARDKPGHDEFVAGRR